MNKRSKVKKEIVKEVEKPIEEREELNKEIIQEAEKPRNRMLYFSCNPNFRG